MSFLLRVAVVALLACSSASGLTPPPPVAQRVGYQACTAIKRRVDVIEPGRPVLLRSYDHERGVGESDELPLHTAAFAYDNALAAIALLACDKQPEALRIGEALRLAAMSDKRLRNAYRAGAVVDKALPNGWWDAKQNRWVEDAYQMGSATGNVAWTGLAMLTLYDATKETKWRDASAKLAQWIVDNTRDSHGAGGFSGGVIGFDAQPQKLTWKSTEHNIDLVALFDGLARAGAPGAWKSQADHARRFVQAQWDAASGHFWVGSLPDGVTPNRDISGLDAQLWAQLLPDAPQEWRRAIEYVEREHAVAGGFDFNADRDGLWLEGTAQAALVYRKLGREDGANKLFAAIVSQVAAGGFVYATREPRITTGLALGADSTSADFYYYRRPHLGATAWAALAALNRNPFVGTQ